MQTLGISETTPRTESRLKSLFWPSVQNATDMDYLGRQGFWVGTIAAVLVLWTWLMMYLGHAPVQHLVFFLLATTYVLCAFGIREHDRFAAAVLFAIFLINTLIQPGVLGLLLTAILFSNVRAVWIAKSWQAGSEDAEMPPRFNTNFFDVLVDQVPQKTWPVLRWLCYPLSSIMLLLSILGLFAIFGRHLR